MRGTSMKPRANLLNFEQAREQLLGCAVGLTATETLPILHTQGRVLAGAVVSPLNVPGLITPRWTAMH